MTRRGDLRKFYGFQIDPSLEGLEGETIFVNREGLLILGLGRDIDGEPSATPHYYDPIPQELEEVVINYISRIYRPLKVDYTWSRKRPAS